MAKYTYIMIPIEGNPHIISEKDVTTIDETKNGICSVPNYPKARPRVHPMFIQLDNRWKTIEVLLRKYEESSKVLTIYAPDCGWFYSPNAAMIMQYGAGTIEEKIINLCGNIVIKIKTTSLKNVCKAWNEIFTCQ